MSEKNYSLSVRDPWLYYIQIGKKKVEGRSGTASKFRHWIGKKVTFFNADRKIPVKVIAIRHYPDLCAYLRQEKVHKVLPGIKIIGEAEKIYHSFYSDEQIKKNGGMLAIEVELL